MVTVRDAVRAPLAVGVKKAVMVQKALGETVGIHAEASTVKSAASLPEGIALKTLIGTGLGLVSVRVSGGEMVPWPVALKRRAEG